jgi:hypothetical protein
MVVLTQPTAAVPGAQPPTTGPTSPIPALVSLLAEADRLGIRQCSWKSNEHLDAGLAGTTDVDLLVDPRDLDRFRALLARHGLRPLVPSPGGAHPGIEHHLGMDRASGRLFHLHVHDRLVVGEHGVKNYRLPMERSFLDTARRVDGATLPLPEVELAVLSIRALLKYRARDVVKDVLDIRSIGVPEEIRAEIAWLMAQTDLAAVRRAVAEADIAVPAELLVRFLQVVRDRPRSGLALLGLRTRLRHRLRAHRRRSRVGVEAERLRVAWARRSRLRRGPPRRRMTPAGGGVVVAVVGADGAGKSTVTSAVATWLGWKLDVRVMHLGSNDPSWVTQGLYLVFRGLRRSHAGLASRGRGRSLVRAVAVLRDDVLALHCLAVVRDRRRVHRRGRAAARGGSVVLFDRFPLVALADGDDLRVLDGPRIVDRVHGASPLGALLRRVERRAYRRFEPPDRVIALDVPPAVAIARKPDHDAAVVTAKARAVAVLRAARDVAAPVRFIDVDRPLDEVLHAVQREVWDAL